jgi:hypothetical protein
VYEEGDTLRYVYESSGTVEMPDSTDTGRVERSYEKRMEVEEITTEITPRGYYLLDLIYHLDPESFTIAQDAPERITLHLEMTPQGRIIEVHGVETAKPLFGDIDFESYFEQAQPVFPDRPLEIGDSWTQEVKVLSPEAEPIVTSSTYVLLELTEEDGEPVAVIGVEGEIYLPITYKEKGEGADQTVSAEERIRVRGSIVFAHELGRTRRVELDADATFTKIDLQDGETVRKEYNVRETSTMRLVLP